MSYGVPCPQKRFGAEPRPLRFTRAIYRGQLWVNEHTADSHEVIAPFPLIDTTFRAQYGLYQSINAGTRGGHPEEHFRICVMIEAGELEDFVPFSELMNTTIARKAVGELD